MDASLSDRNLLFGILAFQNDFISRDELISAVHHWLQDKSRPVSRILVDQERLTDDEHQLIDALTRVHMARHNGNVVDSLIALSSIGSLREDLRGLAIPEIDATLEYVAANRKGSEADGTVGLSEEKFASKAVGKSTSSGRRFRILHPHAKGGLGEVSIAEDTELNRQVALKEIQDRFADDSHSRSRFLLEAEVTGGLEHPGVVPVYGLGQYTDGRPFYAMRFIHGDSLQQATDAFHSQSSRPVNRHRLELRELLGRFVDVCQAMEYAHSRGVLHRDLKPGNIMLGKYGETLIVDWGLSKVIGRFDPVASSEEKRLQPSSGSDSAPTQMGQAIGTPAFMSPEQAAGRHDELSPASDVYCLGATLFCVLTGQSPVREKDVDTCLRKVQKGEIPQPRDVNRRVPKSLSSICLKAMALNPRDRYQSARELADEVERWMADEPVCAYREPLVSRIARWVRRHQAVAASAALLLVVAALASAGFAWQIERSRQLIASEKERADRARDRAELNFQRSLDAVELMLTRVGDERLREIPFLTNVRREILEDALQFYTDTLSDEQDRAEVRLQTARGHRVLARCNIMLGRFTDGQRHFELSLQLMQSLYKDDPISDDLILDLATTHDNLGSLFRERSQPRKATQHLQEALRLIGTMEVRTQECNVTKANALGERAAALHDMGEIEAAFADYSSAKLLLQEVLRQDPENPRLLYRLQAVLQSRGTVNALLSEPAKAVEDLMAAIEYLDRLRQLGEDLPSYRSNRANALMRLGVAWTALAKHSDAEVNLKKALEIWSQMHRDFPAVQRFQIQHAACWHNLAELYHKSRRLERASSALSNSISTLEELRQSTTLEPDTLADLANSYTQLAAVHFETGASGEAESAMRGALTRWDETAKRAPDVITYHVMVAAAHNNLAKVLVENGQLAEAEQRFRESIRRIEQLQGQIKETGTVMHDRANSWMQLATLLVDLGKNEEAEQAYVTAGKLFEDLSRRNFEEPRYLRQYAATCHNFAVFQHQQGRRTEAIDNFRESIRLLVKGVEKFDQSPALRQDLASSWFMLGQVLAVENQTDEAKVAWANSEQIWLELNRRHEGVPDLESGLDVVRARKILFDGQPESAADIADKLAARYEGRKADAYSAVCILAWCLEGLSDEDSDSARALAVRCRTSALQLLRDLAEHGGVTAPQLQNDVDLAALRDLPPFQQLVQKLQSRTPSDR